MGLEAKLLNVGLVLVVLIPIAVLFVRRWRRGDLRYGGLWMSRSAFEPRGEADREGGADRGPTPPRDREGGSSPRRH